uniref:Restin isoform b n=1 Tax=Apis cerana TaxID=7461 RepID=V9I718_APICE
MIYFCFLLHPKFQRPGLRTSTPARITLQETLKEKEQEIEILRKERDLERERITKAANQADQAEQSLISIVKEYEQYREKMQKTVSEAEVAFSKLLEEKNALVLQLEEEKRKCEDLLFRFEEESINKDDIQKERSEQCVSIRWDTWPFETDKGLMTLFFCTAYTCIIVTIVILFSISSQFCQKR